MYVLNEVYTKLCFLIKWVEWILFKNIFFV